MSQHYISVVKEMKQFILQAGHSEQTFSTFFGQARKSYGTTVKVDAFSFACRQYDIEHGTWMHFFKDTPQADHFPGINPRGLDGSESMAQSSGQANQWSNDLGIAASDQMKSSQVSKQEGASKGYWNPTTMGRYPGPSRKNASETCHNYFD